MPFFQEHVHTLQENSKQGFYFFPKKNFFYIVPLTLGTVLGISRYLKTFVDGRRKVF